MSREIKIAGYSTLQEIGQGGMGKVYRAFQEGVKRTVALKTLEQSCLLDNDSARRMVREARISGKLLHENIVKIHDAGESEGIYFISMELLPGGDLAARVQQGLTPSKAISYAMALADALGYAHREGFVHRDIKPENIMLRENGTPVITDFGIARPIDSRTNLTVAGAIIGTPQFMSPEQTRGLPVDGRSDLYSLASVLFFMLTGEALFKADSVLALTYQQVHHPIPRLLAPFHRLQWFFAKALAKEPEQRYQSGTEMKTALEKLHAQCLKLPQKKVPFERVVAGPSGKPRKKNMLAFGLPLILISLAAGSALWYQLVEQQADGVAATETLNPAHSADKKPSPGTSEADNPTDEIKKVSEDRSESEAIGEMDVGREEGDIKRASDGPDKTVAAETGISGQGSPAATDQLANLQSRIKPLLARSRALVENSSLERVTVQQIVSQVFAARALVPDIQGATEILEDLETRLTERFYDSLSNGQFTDAEEQLSSLAMFNSEEKMAFWRGQMEQRQQQMAQQQKQQKQQQREADIRRLVTNAEKNLAGNTVDSFKEARQNYSQILLLDGQHKDGLRLQADYQQKLLGQIQQALGDKRFADAELWITQLSNEPKAIEWVSEFRQKLAEDRQQQQQQMLLAKKKAGEIADLKQSIDDLLAGPLLSLERIKKAEDKLVQLRSLEATAVKRSTQDDRLANAYQQLADNLSAEKNYEQALGVVEEALAKLPTAANLLAAREQILRAKQKRRRNIISF